MKQIPLTQGKFALVDDEDFPLLSRFEWHTTYSGQEQGERAARTLNILGKHVCLLMEAIIFPCTKGGRIMHINKNTLDNTKNNLRCVSAGHLMQTATKRKAHAGKECTSKYKGVSWAKNDKKWIMRIYFEGGRYFSGRFETEKEAAKAYNEKARELYGKFAYQNKID